MFIVFYLYQADNPTSTLCPGMRCRGVFDNFINDCGDVAGVPVDILRQQLIAFDGAGKYYYHS